MRRFGVRGRRTAIALVALAAAVAGVFIARSGSDGRHSRSAESVIGPGGGSLRLEGLIARVPPRAFHTPTHLRLTRQDHPSAHVYDRISRAASPAYGITSEHQPSRPVSLEFEGV